MNYNPRFFNSETKMNNDIIKILKNDKEIFRIFPFYKKGQFAQKKMAKYENFILTPDLNAYYELSSTLSRLSFRLRKLEKLNDLISLELTS